VPIMRFKLPKAVQSRVDQHYLDVSLSRVLPLICLIIFGVLMGLVFNTGVGHPYDKIIHVAFYALLTLSIHALFCCRLRISAVVAFAMGALGEGLQAFVPHHEASLSDLFANGIGVAMVVAAIALIRSEEKQILRDQPVDFDLKSMGLEPFQSDDSSSRSSEK
jgi:glucitol/sorbitol PTS system EIIB component